MANYNRDFTFDQLSRIGDDSCSKSQNDMQNVSQSNYMLNNFFSQDSTLKRPIDFATSQPNIFLKGGNQVGLNGTNIDDNSNLLFGSSTGNFKCPISLFQRPFATVPYLGRGVSKPVLESHLQQGDMVQNKKSINTTTEQSYMPYSNYPLLPQIENTVTNPANLVEGVASEGWVRGGISSREYQKNKDYKSGHNQFQY